VRIFSCLALLMSMPLMASCSSKNDGPPRRSVVGEVTYDSLPLEYGHIRFIPQPEGPLTIAVVTDGKYEVPASHGVPLGNQRVEILALPKPTPSTGDEVSLPTGSAEFKDLPEKFNRQSELTADIPSGQGQLRLDFHLTK